MNRVVGIETEYGCLVSGSSAGNADAWPARVKNHLFRKAKAGVLDLGIEPVEHLLEFGPRRSLRGDKARQVDDHWGKLRVES